MRKHSRTFCPGALCAPKIFEKLPLGAEVPISLVDFGVASYLLNNGINIPKINASYIYLAKDNELSQLADQLMLSDVDKESIIRILFYMGKLNNDMNLFEIIPYELLSKIAVNLDRRLAGVPLRGTLIW